MPLNEILVLHHSHLDVGYTHSQPVLWELQREYIDLALDLLEETADWPEGARPKWMCEVTAPVCRWLETASPADVGRFAAFVRAGRLAIAGMRYNVTPLNTAAQLARQLAPIAGLRERLGARITTAIQHDVNGVPWPLADLLLDHGMDLFVMGINGHLGGVVQPRPGVFRWRTPSGRELRVMNGNHYTMFDQIFLTWDRSLDSMQRGLADYVAHLERIGYPHDFLYLTTTAAPEMWDNSPPNPSVARLIRQWNEAGLQPPVRYVTTEDLAERIHQIPEDELPLLSGDWTDYWNFGCASTARHVAVSRAAKRALDAADRLNAGPRNPAVQRAAERARDLLDLFDEHTWSHWNTVNRLEPALVQDHLKAALPIEARELARYVLMNELEAVAGNPAFSETGPEHVLLVNPSPVARCEYVEIPTAWRQPGRHLRCRQFTPPLAMETQTCGPVELPAFGVKRVALAQLTPAADDARLSYEGPATWEPARKGVATIESPAHRLTYDSTTGRILSLFDKRVEWDVLPGGAEYDFFGFVRERPDALFDGSRDAYFERDLAAEKLDGSCWKPWRAVRERAARVVECRVTRTAGSVTLDRLFEAPSTAGLRHRITLRADSPVIAIDIEVDKLDYTDPEAIYFVLPLSLATGWRCHFDTGGLPVELDADQLPGACRGWFTVDSFAAMYDDRRGVTLFCPDAPMVMAGGFHFGPPLQAVPRDADPLMLAWAMNNYWTTNFPVTQPGKVRLRYGLLTHGVFDQADVAAQADAFANPIIAHPAF